MDLGSISAAVLRTGPFAARDDRVALSLRLIGSVLDGRARLADLSPDLAHDVRAAQPNSLATLILPAGPGPARVDIDGRQYPIPAALRDALVDAAKLNASEARLNAAPSPAPALALPQAPLARETAVLQLPTQALVVPADLRGAAAEAATLNTLAAAGTLRQARGNDAKNPPHAATFDAPVLDARALRAGGDNVASVIAANLAARVSGSGAFFEAHVAQWVRGERSEGALRAEASDLARVAARDPAQADARSTIQVETLQRQAIALSGPAWHGQPMQLELGRDPHAVHDAEQGGGGAVEPVFAARLRIELPHLGAVEARVRLAGDRIAILVEGESVPHARALEAALPEIREALAARGLKAILLQAIPAAPAEAR